FLILRAEGIVPTFSRQIPRPSRIASNRKTIANFSITDDGIVGRLQPLSWNTLVFATLERDGHVFEPERRRHDSPVRSQQRFGKISMWPSGFTPRSDENSGDHTRVLPRND